MPKHNLQQQPNNSTLEKTTLETFIENYNAKTKRSKEFAQNYRPVLADNRASAGFNFELKEMVYPIVGHSSQGSKIWDLDGNEYLDLMMGFGSNLLGHNPPFVTKALKKQLDKGIQLGPQSEFAGEVAELICELTQMERVAFSNTGTEAIMTAIRLARLVTGRNKIAIFSGSYHGHFDGTLVKPKTLHQEPSGIPIAPGIPSKIAEDSIVLEYGNDESLEIIKAHQQELAAVLVVPVQTNRVDLQPKTFLQQLRQLTKESGITLIFDEMVTGFRIHPGGAQAWFDIEADLATYGKVIGGGMPISVIAGKAAYMDGIDGGNWNYGDDSCPQATTTFFAGTYCKHPLAIAASKVILEYLQQQGASLQQKLNQRTSAFIENLNACFQEYDFPLRMTNFGSLFGIDYSTTNLSTDTFQKLELLQYKLLYRGVFLLRGGGYLSTAHTDDDLNFIIDSVRNSLDNLQN